MANLSLESKILLGLGLSFGLLAVVFVPPAITYDGPSHYFRAFQVAEGKIRAAVYSDTAVGGMLPTAEVRYVNSLWSSYWGRRDFGTLTDWSAQAARDEKVAGRERVEFTNTAIYSPLNYLFPAMGMGLARSISPSPLLASRLGSLCNLLGYLGLLVLALEKIPRFWAGLALIASCPMLIVQAASLSADAINFALPVLRSPGSGPCGSRAATGPILISRS